MFRQLDLWVTSRNQPGQQLDAPSQARVANEVSFALALGGRVLHFNENDASRLFHVARDLVRPQGRGPTSANDLPGALEVATYRATLAMLYNLPNRADDYLDSIGSRIEALQRTPSGAALVARILLARVIVRDSRTLPFSRPQSTIESLSRLSSEEWTYRLDLSRTDAAFKNLPQVEELAAEVDVRRGVVMHRLGQNEKALTLLDGGISSATDSDVQYWAYLFKGRVLQALGRLGEATAAYRRALSIGPGYQTAALALAAALHAEGNFEEAQTHAASARAKLPDERDPWWDYWRGDRRLLGDLLSQIQAFGQR
ncbi:MAG: tetratricopeptide repeat protein [Vicinamibacterales bacterium]